MLLDTPKELSLKPYLINNIDDMGKSLTNVRDALLQYFLEKGYYNTEDDYYSHAFYFSMFKADYDYTIRNNLFRETQGGLRARVYMDEIRNVKVSVPNQSRSKLKRVFKRNELKTMSSLAWRSSFNDLRDNEDVIHLLNKVIEDSINNALKNGKEHVQASPETGNVMHDYTNVEEVAESLTQFTVQSLVARFRYNFYDENKPDKHDDNLRRCSLDISGTSNYGAYISPLERVLLLDKATRQLMIRNASEQRAVALSIARDYSNLYKELGGITYLSNFENRREYYKFIGNSVFDYYHIPYDYKLTDSSSPAFVSYKNTKSLIKHDFVKYLRSEKELSLMNTTFEVDDLNEKTFDFIENVKWRGGKVVLRNREEKRNQWYMNQRALAVIKQRDFNQNVTRKLVDNGRFSLYDLDKLIENMTKQGLPPPKQFDSVVDVNYYHDILDEKVDQFDLILRISPKEKHALIENANNLEYAIKSTIY